MQDGPHAESTGTKQVMVALPSYDGRMQQGLCFALMQMSKRKDISPVFRSVDSSSLTRSFNRLWAMALSERNTGLTHFLMIHDDVVPEHFFLDKMMDIMEAKGADVLSVVSPQKSAKGLTSTGFDTRKFDLSDEDKWRTVPMTMTQIHAAEATFTHPKLLINTGLMLVDMRKLWVEQIHFHFETGIVNGNGVYAAREVSEDWVFSKEAAKAGASLWVTREVAMDHWGKAMFPNNRPWGTVKKLGELPQ